jgi:hypothetical protein
MGDSLKFLEARGGIEPPNKGEPLAKVGLEIKEQKVREMFRKKGAFG